MSPAAGSLGDGWHCFAARSGMILAIMAMYSEVAVAEPALTEAPGNVVVISASGQLEVPQDWLTMSLTASRDGSDAQAVQRQLKQTLEAALAVLKPPSSPGQMDVRTGALGVYPRHGDNGKIIGWQGTAEVILEGRDFLLISSTAAKVASMGVGQVSFSLSRESRQTLESDAQALAIERFKARAVAVAKGFGFSGYSLREITVTSVDQGERPVYARAMASAPKMSIASDAPLPVEAGKSLVSVTVSGSVQLH